MTTRNSVRHGSEDPLSLSNVTGRASHMRGRRTHSSSFSNRKRNQPLALNAGNLRHLSHGTPASSRPVGTSRSSCSCSVATLEETIADVMGIRMQSLTDLGARIEELSSLHRQEECVFRQQVGSVLQQLETARLSQLGTEQDYEALLKKERAESHAVMSLMQRFKTEGAEVISTMKRSLQEVKEKWKAEVERNAHLTAQLRQYSKKITPPPEDIVVKDSEASVLRSENKALQTKVQALVRLLEEEDAVIVELQERNKALEKKVSVLIQQRNRLLDIEAQHVETEEFNTEYNELLNQVRYSDVDQNKMPPAKKVDVLTRFTKMLLQRLQAEQRQRLRVEEQTVRMASEHDRVVRALEARIKSIEGQSSNPTPSNRQSASYADVEQACSGIPSNEMGENPIINGEVSSAWEQLRGGEALLPLGGDNNMKDIPCCDADTRDRGLRQSEPAPNDNSEAAVHAALEAQLLSVASNFRRSIEEWNALPLGEGKPLREEDFYPD
ncbi:hypothetical protein DQ04_06491020 [Trypanosoma grayi]|uniref:hypothetical protein n=1 Tax=Trypanosoma grayi TaxID=71804 RepID=UPI0004F434C9|nr:hypothetical protein DQ04_06491020 [Trypanosoma grayi]KEG08761.1 hypothetical protein DQ04_06491020 [Trypanosoma grayi]